MLLRALWCCWDPHLPLLPETPYPTCCWDPHLPCSAAETPFALLRPLPPPAAVTPLVLLRPSPLRAAGTPSCCWDPHLCVLLRPLSLHDAETPTSPCCWDTFWDSHLPVLLRSLRAAETPTSLCCWDPSPTCCWDTHIPVLLRPRTCCWGLFISPLHSRVSHNSLKYDVSCILTSMD